jgi:hypothetical protein
MTSIFILVRKERVVTGHNETGEIVNVATVDPYDTSSSHPAFTSKEKADSYIATLPKHRTFGLTPYEIIIKE